jgi:hypothetical protein
MLAREGFKSFALSGQALAENKLAGGVNDSDFDFFFMYIVAKQRPLAAIESCELHNGNNLHDCGRASRRQQKCWHSGKTVTTYSSSQLNRVDHACGASFNR